MDDGSELGLVEAGFNRMAAGLRERERLRDLWLVPLQQIVYRQLMYLVLLHSALTAVAGHRLRWQKMRRTGVALSGAG